MRLREKGGGAVAGALSASLAPDLPDPDMPHYFYTTKMYTGITELLINTFCCVDSNGCTIQYCRVLIFSELYFVQR